MAPTIPSEPVAALFFLARHRLDSDGQGVTTLVGFHGCPLRCRCCLNPAGCGRAPSAGA